MSVEQLARCEFKYAVRPEELDDLRRALALRSVVDRTGVTDADGWYTIDSLYFDTPDLEFFRESMDERPVRRKLRVRTYPDTPASIVKVEVKRRIHELILKTSLVVPQAGWQQWLRPGADAGRLKPESRAALEEFTTLARHLNAAPRMLVRYKRVAYHSTIDDYVRVTFDRQITAQPLRQLTLEGDGGRWMALDRASRLGPGGLLMEVKFRNRAPLWVGDLIRRFGLTRQGFSKYGAAVKLCARENGRIWDLAPAVAAARREAQVWTY